MSTEETEVAAQKPESSSDLPQRAPLPDVADLIFLLIIVMLVMFIPNYVLGDGSTGWHLATGKWILTNHAIPNVDLFSSTFPTKEWVPYEWLSDVFGAALDNIGGLKLVATATACGIAWLFALVYLECRRSGCHMAAALILTLLAVLCSSIHWLARPLLFTWYGVFLIARHLEKFRLGQESTKRLLITVPILMALWSNFHPAFLVGLALIIIYLVSEVTLYIFTSASFKPASLRRIQVFAAALASAVGATFINPNGARMYSYIFHYLRQTGVLQQTQEFMPGNLHDLHAICMLLIMSCFVMALAGARRAIGLAPLLTVLAFGYLGLTSMRNEPLFAIVAVPIVGQLLSSFSLRKVFAKPYAKAPWLENMLEKIRPKMENFDVMERVCNMHLLPLGATILLFIACVMGGSIGPVVLVESDWDPKNKPVKTLKCVDEFHLDWRNGLNLDNWGGYIFYKTGKRVFMDDRLDFYGSEFFNDYGRMMAAYGERDEKVMDKHNIKWVLFPPKSTLIAQLRKSPDWQLLCEDQASVLMIRKGQLPQNLAKPPENKPEQQETSR